MVPGPYGKVGERWIFLSDETGRNKQSDIMLFKGFLRYQVTVKDIVFRYKGARRKIVEKFQDVQARTDFEVRGCQRKFKIEPL